MASVRASRARRPRPTAAGPLLVLAAWEPELSPLRARLAALGDPKTAPVLETVGVGAIEAAVGTTRALAAHRPAAVVLVGTAGLYPGTRSLPIGGVAVARRVRLACAAVARDEAYLPAPLPAAVDCAPDLALRLAAAGAPLVDVACPVGITRSTATARRLARHTGASVETLEALAVARACAPDGLPFAAVLGVSNEVGPQAHAQWKRHGALASEAAAELVIRFWRASVAAR